MGESAGAGGLEAEAQGQAGAFFLMKEVDLEAFDAALLGFLGEYFFIEIEIAHQAIIIVVDEFLDFLAAQKVRIHSGRDDHHGGSRQDGTDTGHEGSGFERIWLFHSEIYRSHGEDSPGGHHAQTASEEGALASAAPLIFCGQIVAAGEHEEFFCAHVARDNSLIDVHIGGRRDGLAVLVHADDAEVLGPEKFAEKLGLRFFLGHRSRRLGLGHGGEGQEAREEQGGGDEKSD